jgi:hypothetical protein
MPSQTKNRLNCHPENDLYHLKQVYLPQYFTVLSACGVKSKPGELQIYSQFVDLV